MTLERSAAETQFVARRQFRRHELRLAALGLGVGEIELDLHAVRIEQEELIEPLVVDLALLELDAVLVEMLDHVVQAGGAEADVVDHAGAGGGLGLLADVFLAVLADVLAAGGDVQHVAVAEIEPVDRELEIRARADAEAQHLDVPVLGRLDILRLQQEVFHMGEGHVGPPWKRCGPRLAAPDRSATVLSIGHGSVQQGKESTNAGLLGCTLEDQRSGRVQEIHRSGAGDHRQVRRQGSGARRPLPDHGGPGRNSTASS